MLSPLGLYPLHHLRQPGRLWWQFSPVTLAGLLSSLAALAGVPVPWPVQMHPPPPGEKSSSGGQGQGEVAFPDVSLT